MLKYECLRLLGLFLFALIGIFASDEYAAGFTYNGFQSANLSLHGVAELTDSGLLKLTSDTSKVAFGHAFSPNPISFRSSSNGSALSFSTTFVFSVVSKFNPFAGHGLAFVIAPTIRLPGALPTQYLGLFNFTNNGKSTNHVFAVEIDTFQNLEFGDINDHHIGIDLNGLESVMAKPATYFVDNKSSQSRNLLTSGQFLQVWVEYDGLEKQTNVTLAPVGTNKPDEPLLSFHHDLSSIMYQNMYVGFSASSGAVSDSHYIAAWSFKMKGRAQELDLSKLPKLPGVGPKEKSKFFTIGFPSISLVFLLTVISCVVYHVRRKRKFAEVLEDWEVVSSPHRFKFKDLYIATKGFSDKELLGSGGFGKVYRGVLPVSEIVIAVKRVSHESRQGMREFVAEVVTIGRLRHRNLVQLLGYCRNKHELLLVYECMPNGSLDKFLYGCQPKFTLGWNQRFRVIKGVASGLFYLHEEWERVVVHRDVKASNVLLDSEFNGRLGDFGLARSYDHGADPETTHVAGTFGYLAPECARKATTLSDVYAFGAFLLEVACGRRPIEPSESPEKVILVNWVFSCLKNGDILESVDPNLGTDFKAEEVELVLKLGLLCSQFEAVIRPTTRQVVQYLGSGIIPPLVLFQLGISSSNELMFAHLKGVDVGTPSVVAFHLSGPR